MGRDERGYIVVETIGSFLLFVLLNVSILTLINVVAVQARIHYAITQAAETVSMYCYVLDSVGAADHLVNMAGKAQHTEEEINAFKTNINGVLDGINSLGNGNINEGTFHQIEDNGQGAINRVEGWVDDFSADPKSMMQYLMNYGLQQGSNLLFEQMVRPLIGRYLKNGGQSGDEFLKAFHVVDGLKGLDFYTFSTLALGNTRADDSMLLTSEGDVKIIVQYEIEYGFGALPLPFNTLKVTQEATTKAWLSGKGEGYKP